MQTAGFSEDDAWVWWSDTLGVGAFAVIGTMNGIRAGVPLLCCAICGMFTSTFGGLIRDVLPACSFSPSLPRFLRLKPPAPAFACPERSVPNALAGHTRTQRAAPFAVLRIVRLHSQDFPIGAAGRSLRLHAAAGGPAWGGRRSYARGTCGFCTRARSYTPRRPLAAPRRTSPLGQPGFR